MNILITGATGFIGSQLTEKLVKNGKTVRALCRKGADIAHLEKMGVEIIYGDICNAHDVNEAIQGSEQIFHLAALAKTWSKDPNQFYNVNVTGTKNILESASLHNINKVVVTSTSLVFGPSNGKAVNEDAEISGKLYTDYVRTKAISENYINHFCKKSTEVVVVNPTRVFGPGFLTEGNSVTLMIKQYLEGSWRLILGSGKAIGNYAYIDDVVNGHLLAMEHGKNGQRYILGGEDLSFLNFFKLLEKHSKCSYKLFKIPSQAALLFSRFEETKANWFNVHPLITPEWVQLFLKDGAYSSDKAKLELGYKITPFAEAITKTIDWIEKNYTAKKGVLK